jgi:hypothetical protein
VRILLALLFLSVNSFAAKKLFCDSKYHTFVRIEDPGAFLRVDPSGRYVLLSNAVGGTHIYELRKDGEKIVPVKIETPLLRESFPIENPEGEWEVIASPNHGTEKPLSMHYYSFKEILQQKGGTQPLYTTTFSDLYHSVGMLESSGDKRKIRTALMSGLKYTDYEYKIEDSAPQKESFVAIGESQLCANSNLGRYSQPVLDREGRRVALNRQPPDTDMSPVTSMADLRRREYGDAQKSVTGIYKILENGDCRLMTEIPFATSKVGFGYKEGPTKDKILLSTGDSQALIFDIKTKESQPISQRGEQTTYPGFTKDGRVIYVSSRLSAPDNYEVGLVVVDVPAMLRDKFDPATAATDCSSAKKSAKTSAK